MTCIRCSEAPMVVFHELMDETAKVALAERNDSVQTFRLDGQHPPLRVRVQIRAPSGQPHAFTPASLSSLRNLSV